MINRRVLHSVGQYNNAVVFDRSNFETRVDRSAKIRESDNPFGDGKIDVAGLRVNPLSGNNIDIDFLLTSESKYSLDFIKKVFYSESILKIFFVELTNYNSASDFEAVRIFWNYARVTSGLADENSSNERLGLEAQSYSLRLSLLYPYYFEADNAVLLDTSTFSGIYPLAWGDSQINYGQAGIDYGVVAPNFEKAISSLTPQQRIAFFGKCEDVDSLAVTDFFLKPDQKFPTYTVSAYTVNTGTSYSPSTDDFDLDLNTTIPSRINLIKMDGSGSAVFVNGDTLEVYNNTTNSGFKITWNNSTSSASTVYFNTYNLTLYDGSVGVNYSPVTDYTIEPFSSTTDDLLSFSALFRPNPNKIPAASSETFQIVSGLSNNITMQIKNLKTFI